MTSLQFDRLAVILRYSKAFQNCRCQRRSETDWGEIEQRSARLAHGSLALPTVPVVIRGARCH
jgi:hypothetical protein